MADIKKITYIISDDEKGMHQKDVIKAVNGKPISGKEVDHTFITNNADKPYEGVKLQYERDGFSPNDEETFKKRIYGKRQPDPHNLGWYTSPLVANEELTIEEFELEANLPVGTAKHIRDLTYQWNGKLSIHLYTTDEDPVKKIAKYIDDTEIV